MYKRMEVLCLGALMATLALTGAPPRAPERALAFRCMPCPALPKMAVDMTVDSTGCLWVVDRAGGKIVVLNSEGKFVRAISSPGSGPGQLSDPLALALNESLNLLAVCNSTAALDFFEASSGRFKSTLVLPGPYEAFTGFFVTPSRIVYCGSGRESAPRTNGPFRALSLFSTSMEGRGLRIERSFQANAEEAVGLMLFGHGFAIPFKKDVWAIGRSLPAQVLLVDDEGRVLRESRAQGIQPRWPLAKLSEPGWTTRIKQETPHAVGLIKDKDKIGLVWVHPPKPGPIMSIGWFRSDLTPGGTTPISLEAVPGKIAGVYSLAQAPSGRVYLLASSTQDSGDKVSHLYVANLP